MKLDSQNSIYSAHSSFEIVTNDSIGSTNLDLNDVKLSSHIFIAAYLNGQIIGIKEAVCCLWAFACFCCHLTYYNLFIVETEALDEKSLY